MHLTKKIAMALTCAGVLLAVTQPGHAANWLMLQGTEESDTAPRAKLWGFIQPQFQYDNSDANAQNGFIPPKLVGPNLEAQEAFTVFRARIGVRGIPLPLDSKVNYFLLLEMGNNAITAGGSSFAKATDASITLNHFPGARIRTGLFKYPGAEEGLQAIHVFDYINFTEVTNQLLLERFPNDAFTANIAPLNPDSTVDLGAGPTATSGTGTSLNGFDNPVGAFRDVGIQVFDAFRVNDLELSYAVMYGNGNGLNVSDNDDNKDLYTYIAGEWVFGGSGPRREGLKVFAWDQRGKRTYDGNNDTVNEEYDRDRSGFGIKYLKRPFRATAEYIKADGMIFVGPDKPSFDIDAPGGAGSGLEGEAGGWYVEGGWYIFNTGLELDLRYDILNRLTDDQFEMKFETVTVGLQYHINKKTRVTLDVSDRDFEAANFASGVGPNLQLEGVKKRYALQLTSIF